MDKDDAMSTPHHTRLSKGCIDHFSSVNPDFIKQSIKAPNPSWSPSLPFFPSLHHVFLHRASPSQRFQGKEGCVELPFIHRHVSSTQMLVLNFAARHVPLSQRRHTWELGGRHSRLSQGTLSQINSNYNFFRKREDVGGGGGSPVQFQFMD